MSYVEIDENIKSLMKEIKDQQYLDPEKMYKKSKELVAIAKENNNQYALCYGLLYISDYYYSCKTHNELLEQLNEAMTLAQNNRFDDLLLAIYNLYGIAVSHYYDYSLAIDFFLKALKIAKNINDIKMITMINTNICDTLILLKNFELAKPYCIAALKYYHKIPINEENIHILLVIMLNLADIYSRTHQEIKALIILDKYHDKIKNKCYYTLYLHGRAIRAYCYYKLKEYDKCNDIIDYVLNNNDIKGYSEQEIIYLSHKKLLDICLELKDKQRCKKLLNVLKESSFIENNVKYQLELIKSEITYTQLFRQNEHLNKLYEQYYLVSCKEEDKSNLFCVNSVINKIELYKEMEDKQNVIKLHKDLLKIAKKDDLTNIYNRRSFKQRIDLDLKLDDIKYLGVIILDLDYFKIFNDRYGHLKGDELLCDFATCLTTNNKKIIPHRCGGDEFMCILENCKQEEIESYLSKLSLDYNNIQRNEDKITFSAGYYNCIKNDSINANFLIEKADLELYKIKNSSRNDYCGYSENG